MATSTKSLPGNPKLAVAYIRCSLDEQKLSPEAQRAAIEAWASRERVTIISWCIDAGVCSVTPIDQRPGLMEAIAAIKEHSAGVLVCAKRDRLARDVIISAMLERLVERDGAVIVSADGIGNGNGPEAQLMRSIVDAFAQYERALIRARTKAAMAVKKQRGERAGEIPFGYQLSADGVRIEPNPVEVVVASRARELSSTMGAFRIARQLTVEGFMSRSGKPFDHSQVARMLRKQEAA